MLGLSFLLPQHSSAWKAAAEEAAMGSRWQRVVAWAESAAAGTPRIDVSEKADQGQQLKAMVLGLGGGGLMTYLTLSFGQVSSHALSKTSDCFLSYSLALPPSLSCLTFTASTWTKQC